MWSRFDGGVLSEVNMYTPSIQSHQLMTITSWLGLVSYVNIWANTLRNVMYRFTANITTDSSSIIYTLPADHLRFTTLDSVYAAAEATSVANYDIRAAGGSTLRTVNSWHLEAGEPRGNIIG